MSNNTNRSDKAVSINDNLKMSVSLLKDIRGLVREVSGLSDIKKARSLAVAAAPVAEVAEVKAEPAPAVAAPAKRDMVAEATEVAEAITVIVPVITASLRDIARVSYEVSGHGLNKDDIRDRALKRAAVSDMVAGYVAQELSELWGAVKPAVHAAAAEAVERAADWEKREGAENAELDAIRHAHALSALKRDEEERRDEYEYERERKRLERALELKRLRAQLED